MKKHLLIIVTVLLSLQLAAQDCSDLFISEYVEGSGNNKSLELYNPTNDAIDLAGYVLVRYRNGLFTPDIVNLSGTIEPKGTFVAVLDKRDPSGTGQEIMVDLALQAKADTFLCPVYDVNKMMYFNGNDAVTLEKVTGEIVDVFAHIGPPMLEDDEGWGEYTDTTITYNSGGVPTQYTIQDYIVGPLFWLSWTSNHTLIRKPEVTHGVTANPDVFVVTMEWDSLPENTFDSLRFHRCNCTTYGLSEDQITNPVNIFPNPVTGGQVNLEAAHFIHEVQVIDLTGRIVDVQEIRDLTKSYAFHLDKSLYGVYFIRVSLSEGYSYTGKLIIR
ncbi:MAG: lamin tail domain-containing protein [Bacteroidales bacterium]|jgi:hypothetical protein|nr:lamin tail domain-containing protein [Bacteroidales bacterium]